MLLALNNEKLVVRDIKKFSKTDGVAQKKTRVPIFSILKTFFLIITKGIFKVAYLRFQLKSAMVFVKDQMDEDYVKFLGADFRSQEDILIKWEKLSRNLNFHRKNNPTSDSSLTKDLANKSTEIIDSVNSFVEKLKTELYPNLKKPISQDRLKKLSEKFKDLPEDVLNDLISDEHSERI